MIRRALGKILRFVEYSALVFLAGAALGSLVPAILFFGELGPVLTGSFGPWVTIFALAGTLVIFWRWRIDRKRTKLVLAGLGAFATIVTAFVLIRQIGVAQAHGAHIDLVEALFARSQADTTITPVTVTYGQYGGKPLQLDIYRPVPAVRQATAPVFVYIHGGGWGAETLKQRQADYRWFAERGYLVISLEYTLSSDSRHTWNVVQPQLGCALAWIGVNATRYGGDPSRLALWGESAGGNLVINVSYMANKGTLEPSCPGVIPQVDATIALYPVVDPARMHHNPDILVGVFGRMMTLNYTGGTPEQVPDRYATISSRTHISAAAPPTMLIVPEADHLVVPQAAYDFAGLARAAGVKVELIRMPYAEHSFDLKSGSIGNQLVRQSMLRFLRQHGLAAGQS